MEQKYKLKVLEIKEVVKKIDSDYVHKVIQFLDNDILTFISMGLSDKCIFPIRQPMQNLFVAYVSLLQFLVTASHKQVFDY